MDPYKRNWDAYNPRPGHPTIDTINQCSCQVIITTTVSCQFIFMYALFREEIGKTNLSMSTY